VADYGRKSIACGNKQPSQLLTIESGTTERSILRSLVITINAFKWDIILVPISIYGTT